MRSLMPMSGRATPMLVVGPAAGGGTQARCPLRWGEREELASDAQSHRSATSAKARPVRTIVRLR